jgi:hypothetical protein
VPLPQNVVEMTPATRGKHAGGRPRACTPRVRENILDAARTGAHRSTIAATPQTFQQTLRSPIYAGWLTVKSSGDLKPQRANFAPIVTDELFQRVQRVLDGKSVRSRLTTAPGLPATRVRSLR